MLRLKEDVPPKTKPSVGLREDFIDYNLMLVKSEPVDEIGETGGINDPLFIENSWINVKEKLPTTNCEFYGRIALEINDTGARIYQFICDKCSKTFSDLENFDKHITENYLNSSKENANAQNFVIVEADKIKEEITENEVENKCQSTETSMTSVKNTVNDNSNENNCDNSKDFSCSENEDKSYEPKNKKMKPSSGRSVTLSFDYPDKHCVTFFLELLKTHAILWLKKSSVIKPFTIASTNFITEFKKKFPNYNLTKLNLQKAIDRFKSSYERANNDSKELKQKTTEFKTKNTEFLKLCAEIEKNSKEIEKNCDLCKAQFYCPIELQIHKFKRHKVGELPYKCKRCGYGFTTPETLASHEEKHNRVKSFECEICGYACYFESKLLAHRASMHSEDRKPICEVCGLIFPDPTRLYKHKRSHESKNEECKICHKSYHEKWQLIDHMKAHLNERTYICNLCGKGFNRQKNLYIHKRCVHKMKGGNHGVWKQNMTDGNYSEKDSEDEDDMQNFSKATSSIQSEILNTIFS